MCLVETKGPTKKQENETGTSSLVFSPSHHFFVCVAVETGLGRAEKRKQVNQDMAESGSKSTRMLFLRTQHEEAKLLARSVAIDERNVQVQGLKIQIEYEEDADTKRALIQELIQLSKAPLNVELELPPLPEVEAQTPVTSSVPSTPSTGTSVAVQQEPLPVPLEFPSVHVVTQ